ncbi:MAG: hypothetical protein HZB26_10130 [Candidatus Hydrogenedentes bacterium]|nr:hypothetical protein [Candidatus Hydrogenedentota bacterium]
MFSFFGRHKILASVLGSILVAVVLAVAFVGYRTIGPYRSYRADMMKPAPKEAAQGSALEVGVARRDITPFMENYDTWVDADGNGRFEPEKGDTYTDKNGNGTFDLVWMAGFSNNRAAKGVHDQLWARALAVRSNGVTVVMVSLDSIGVFHEKFIKVRKMIDPSLGIDQVVFSCLHNHEAPDTMGIWSYSPFRPRFDHKYMEFVEGACKEVVEEAVKNLKPADTILAQVTAGPDGYVDDSRKPVVYDNAVRCARFVKKGTDDTICTMVEWGNHTETLGGGNSLLTSDFAGYWRDAVENGVPEPNGVKGLGGMCIYFQGLVGGLMTQLHTTVPSRNGKDTFREASFEKAQALGENLAILTVNALRGDKAWRPSDNRVGVAAQTVFIPASGLMGTGMMLGLVHPGWYWGKGKTEIDVVRIGDLEILAIPGELYPEIAEGGVESPDGADYPGPPIEAPPLRSMMNGKLNMMFGLANDEIGYIIPKTQWDTKAPYAYGFSKPQYGEENSVGPNVAPVIHREALALLRRFHDGA